jgi:hypothetical protein
MQSDIINKGSIHCLTWVDLKHQELLVAGSADTLVSVWKVMQATG